MIRIALILCYYVVKSVLKSCQTPQINNPHSPIVRAKMTPKYGYLVSANRHSTYRPSARGFAPRQQAFRSRVFVCCMDEGRVSSCSRSSNTPQHVPRQVRTVTPLHSSAEQVQPPRLRGVTVWRGIPLILPFIR